MVVKYELYPRNTSVNMTDSFQRKILRKILGHTQAMGLWRIRHNEEIYKLYVAAALSTILHLKAQKWGGHVVWTSDSRGGFRRRPVGKMGGCCQKGWLRFDPGTELEGSSMEHHIGEGGGGEEEEICIVLSAVS